MADKRGGGAAGGCGPADSRTTGNERSSDDNAFVMQRQSWTGAQADCRRLVADACQASKDIRAVIVSLFRRNLIMYRGLFTTAVLRRAEQAPARLAALIAVINAKIPEIGELLVKRAVTMLCRTLRSSPLVRTRVWGYAMLLAHLANQRVVDEVLICEIIAGMLKVRHPDIRINLTVHLLITCGSVLLDTMPEAISGSCGILREMLQDGKVPRKLEPRIYRLMKQWKERFKDSAPIIPELDLVESDMQITHSDIFMNEEHDCEEKLDQFSFNKDFDAETAHYNRLRLQILGKGAYHSPAQSATSSSSSGSSDALSSSSASSSSSEAGDADLTAPAPAVAAAAAAGASAAPIHDMTESEETNLKRQIYLTITSSLNFEECVHKLLQQNLDKDVKMLCNMIVQCCSQEKSFQRFYGLLGERLCRLGQKYQDQFDECFATHYATSHRYETSSLRNIAKFYAHLLYTDALEWGVLSYIHLNSEETTSSSRIFIKVVFRELSEHMGLMKLRERLDSDEIREHIAELFPRDHPKKARYAINFFSIIGLGGLTIGLREHLKAAPKQIMQQHVGLMDNLSSDSSSSSPSDDDSSSSDSSDSSSSDGDSSSSKSSDTSSSRTSASSSSESHHRRKRKRRRHRRNDELSDVGTRQVKRTAPSRPLPSTDGRVNSDSSATNGSLLPKRDGFKAAALADDHRDSVKGINGPQPSGNEVKESLASADMEIAVKRQDTGSEDDIEQHQVEQKAMEPRASAGMQTAVKRHDSDSDSEDDIGQRKAVESHDIRRMEDYRSGSRPLPRSERNRTRSDDDDARNRYQRRRHQSPSTSRSRSPVSHGTRRPRDRRSRHGHSQSPRRRARGNRESGSRRESRTRHGSRHARRSGDRRDSRDRRGTRDRHGSRSIRRSEKSGRHRSRRLRSRDDDGSGERCQRRRHHRRRSTSTDSEARRASKRRRLD